MLLVGVYKYGIGSWEAIRQDKSLGLTKKISSVEGDGLPKAPQLQRRIEFLLKVIRVDQEKRGIDSSDVISLQLILIISK